MNNENEFVWTDELVKEFANQLKINVMANNNEIYRYKEKKLTENLNIVMIKKERYEDGNGYDFIMSNGHHVFVERKRLSEIIIAEMKGDLHIHIPLDLEKLHKKFYDEFKK